MKFVRKLASSRSAVSALTHTAPSSFVATDSKKVVFEVAVMGRVENTDVTVTEDFGDTHTLTAIVRFGDEVCHASQELHGRHEPSAHYTPDAPYNPDAYYPDASEAPSGSASSPGLSVRDLLRRNGATVQNIVLWVLYGIWLIVSSIRRN